MSKPPKFLYFDLGNVVLPFDYLVAVRQMAGVAGVPPAAIQKVVFDSGLEDAYERGEMTTEQFYETFCQRTGKRPDCAALLVASSDMFRLDEAVAALILQLRNSGHRTGLLSNTCDAHWRFCVDRKFPILQQLFEVTALSYELRAMKPDPAIYEAAAALAGVAPGEIFFVDDRPEHVAGARQAGFDAVLFTGAAELAAALESRGVRPNGQPA
ncbi:MAG: HAD family phosphatase [Pirellulaceae bacterium]|jgi:HAD superfamily hydrolase (TIGR01509 family)|nr:HAD family phosphatase [Pirellulaceae bacterium]